MQNYARIGTFGILALIALRLGVGWHFYMEGASKVRSNSFSSEGFLTAARGPLKDTFQQLIWDHDGQLRLNQEQVNELFEQATRQANAHFAFTDDQRKDLGRIKSRYFGLDKKERWIGKLNTVYADEQEAIYTYWASVGRLEKMDESPLWNRVRSMRGQKESIENDRMAGVRAAMASVDTIWTQYERQLNWIATPAQMRDAGYFYFSRPGEGLLTTSVVDRIIPYFDMVVGILLILGLFTPVAAWAAALFLISVVLSQMPGYPGTEPTYYQAVEVLALIVLATMGAGRYAGLDFLTWAWWENKRAAKASVT